MQNNNCSGIYIIRCKLTGRVYVGSSKNVNLRLKHHISSLRGSRHASWKLQEAWYEYGEDNFEFLLLEEVLEPELSLFEQKYIDEFNSFFNGFNCRKDAIRAIYRDTPKHLKSIKRISSKKTKPKDIDTKPNLKTIESIEKLYSILPSTVSRQLSHYSKVDCSTISSAKQLLINYEQYLALWALMMGKEATVVSTGSKSFIVPASLAK